MHTIARRLALLTLLVAAPILLAACGGSDDSSTSSSASKESSKASGDDCTPGPAKVDGVDVVRHCGDAQVKLTVNGTTTKLSGGACQQNEQTWTINIGDTVVDPDATEAQRNRVKYFGIAGGDVGAAMDSATSGDSFDTSKLDPKDFVVTFSTGTLSDNVLGKSLQLTLNGDGTSGTFKGTTMLGKVPASGEFSCS